MPPHYPIKYSSIGDKLPLWINPFESEDSQSDSTNEQQEMKEDSGKVLHLKVVHGTKNKYGPLPILVPVNVEEIKPRR